MRPPITPAHRSMTEAAGHSCSVVTVDSLMGAKEVLQGLGTGKACRSQGMMVQEIKESAGHRLCMSQEVVFLKHGTRGSP